MNLDETRDFEKEFEEKYIEYSKNDAPDLWARIEAGLPECDIKDADGIKEKHTKVKQFKWYRYAPRVAACVCLVIIIPALKGSLFGAKSDSAKEEVAYDSSCSVGDMGTEESVGAAGKDNYMYADGAYSDAKTESADSDSLPLEDVMVNEECTNDSAEEPTAPEEDREEVSGDAAGSEMETVSVEKWVVTVVESCREEGFEGRYYLCKSTDMEKEDSIYIKSDEILFIGQSYTVVIELLRETLNDLPVYRFIQYVE